MGGEDGGTGAVARSKHGRVPNGGEALCPAVLRTRQR